MFLAFLVVAVLFPCLSWTADAPCEDRLPASVDASICDDIQSAVFVFAFAIRDIHNKVQDTVLTALRETQKMLDSTVATTIEDVRGMFEAATRKRRAIEDLQSESRALAETVAKNIEAAVLLAGKKIRSSISQAVSNADVQHDEVKEEALKILRKVLNKRSIDDAPVRRDDAVSYDVTEALAAASVEVNNAMKETVTTSIHEYKKIMDFFALRLKELFRRANFKGNVDQAAQDIEELAIKSSLSFIGFYNSSTSVAIEKAITSVEGLLLKFKYIAGKYDQSVLSTMKSLLEAAAVSVSEIVVERKQEVDEEIRSTIFSAAEKMMKDYQTIEGILVKHGV